MEVLSRSEAKAQGLLMYFTGKPCKYGHIEIRRVSNGWCAECERVKARLFAQSHREQQREAAHRSYSNFKEIHKERHRRWMERNPTRKKDNYRRWCRENQEHKNQLSRDWKKRNPAKVRAANALRRAAKLRATPSWVNHARLKEIYLHCPSGFEVDHIIPLQGENVCGLHVPWNLQYLTPFENNLKNNHLSA